AAVGGRAGERERRGRSAADSCERGAKTLTQLQDLGRVPRAGPPLVVVEAVARGHRLEGSSWERAERPRVEIGEAVEDAELCSDRLDVHSQSSAAATRTPSSHSALTYPERKGRGSPGCSS